MSPMCKVVLLVSFVFAANAQATIVLTPESCANLTADILNNAKTYNGLIAHLAEVFNSEERNGIKDFFANANMNAETTIPSASVHQSKVKISGSKIELLFQKDGSFKIGDRVVRKLNGEPIDIFFRKQFTQKQSPVENFLIKTFLPEVKAVDQFELDDDSCKGYGICPVMMLVALAVQQRSDPILKASKVMNITCNKNKQGSDSFSLTVKPLNGPTETRLVGAYFFAKDYEPESGFSADCNPTNLALIQKNLNETLEKSDIEMSKAPVTR